MGVKCVGSRMNLLEYTCCLSNIDAGESLTRTSNSCPSTSRLMKSIFWSIPFRISFGVRHNIWIRFNVPLSAMMRSSPDFFSPLYDSHSLPEAVVNCSDPGLSDAVALISLLFGRESKYCSDRHHYRHRFQYKSRYFRPKKLYRIISSPSSGGSRAGRRSSLFISNKRCCLRRDKISFLEFWI